MQQPVSVVNVEAQTLLWIQLQISFEKYRQVGANVWLCVIIDFFVNA